ncbi:LysR family transcriptional regulator [Sphingomonas sanguinis]|uniref:LysR family transcriptional regulator n=1 Tax=Sphingomonas sanguinis TaxID=33051 RepID=UPI00301A014C
MPVRLSHIPITSLVQVLAVAERLNFRHAATALGVSQSSVSTRIKALEDRLGILIFERRHRGVRLTDAGRRFVAEVAIGIGHLDHAIVTAGAITSGEIGSIRIGISSPVFGGFLAELHRRFRAAHPNVDLIVVEDQPDLTARKVREGGLDIAILMGEIEGVDCHVKHLWTEPFVVALPVTHDLASNANLTWADVVSETFLVPSGGAGFQLQDHIVRRLAERGVRPRIRRCEAGRNTLMQLVSAGDGIKLTTRSATYIPFPGIVFRMLADEAETARFGVMWSPHNRSASLHALLAIAQEMSVQADLSETLSNSPASTSSASAICPSTVTLADTSARSIAPI